jgi:hypothetical protein
VEIAMQLEPVSRIDQSALPHHFGEDDPPVLVLVTAMIRHPFPFMIAVAVLTVIVLTVVGEGSARQKWMVFVVAFVAAVAVALNVLRRQSMGPWWRPCTCSTTWWYLVIVVIIMVVVVDVEMSYTPNRTLIPYSEEFVIPIPRHLKERTTVRIFAD